ncbi:hypothetical protein BDZ89DRAFT_1055404 [Hymenopellis radicata]|nr:hypothetical protein BDZ89DRAFT_1055404 [Hymenopellis radicata]
MHCRCSFSNCERMPMWHEVTASEAEDVENAGVHGYTRHHTRVAAHSLPYSGVTRMRVSSLERRITRRTSAYPASTKIRNGCFLHQITTQNRAARKRSATSDYIPTLRAACCGAGVRWLHRAPQAAITPTTFPLETGPEIAGLRITMLDAPFRHFPTSIPTPTTCNGGLDNNRERKSGRTGNLPIFWHPPRVGRRDPRSLVESSKMRINQLLRAEYFSPKKSATGVQAVVRDGGLAASEIFGNVRFGSSLEGPATLGSWL